LNPGLLPNHFTTSFHTKNPTFHLLKEVMQTKNGPLIII
jgi:hypothetical protein